MQNYNTVQVPKNNLEFLKSSQGWEKLNSLNSDINSDPSFVKKEFIEDLKCVEKVMNDFVCDDSWIGHCAKYQIQSGGKRFRALLALLALQAQHAQLTLQTKP